LAAASSG